MTLIRRSGDRVIARDRLIEPPDMEICIKEHTLVGESKGQESKAEVGEPKAVRQRPMAEC
jgi:hypothetical protein